MAKGSSNNVQVRYFENEGKQITPRFWEFKAIDSPVHSGDSKTIHSNAAIIPKNCSAFKFDASFKDQKAGQYYIVWKVLLQPGFLVSRGFHVQAIVSYDQETVESSGSLDVTIPETRIKDLSVNRWHGITVREQLVIRPHHGAAHIQLCLCNNEDPNKERKKKKGRDEFHNFMVGSVEIHPYANLGPDFISHSPTTGIPFASLNIKRAENIPISRISAATDVDHIAILRVAEDKVHVGIWDYGGIQDQVNDTNSHFDWEPKAEKTLVDNQDKIHEIPLGISLSPDGRQLVVFQEPRIGDWKEGDTVKNATFEFKLFHVSIVMAPRSKKSEMFEIDMDSTGSELTPSNAVSHISSLRRFVGFAKFLPMSASATTAAGEVNGAKAMFVACNGIYLDIFDYNENPWVHRHSIALFDLSPTLSRRITCQMMVESMGSNTFLWVEAQGQVCSTWYIMDGANISYLSGEDNVNFADRMYRSALKMAISPDESIVALAGIDGSVRTFFAKSGIEIRAARFRNTRIEYIGFLGESDQILLIIRDVLTNQLQSRILDPMDLTIRIRSNPIPIPTAGTTLPVVRHIDGLRLENESIVCAAEGTVLRFYRIQDPAAVSTSSWDIADQELADIDAIIDCDGIGEGEDGFGEGGKFKYKLRCKLEQESMGNGEGKFYWVIRVQVKQEINYPDAIEPEKNLLLDFVPEPWLRCLTSEYTEPDQLLTTFFLPCRKRFIIIGLQSIQIWGLPSRDNPNFKLLAIWSMPKDDIFSPSEGRKPRTEVFDHYRNIEYAEVNANYSGSTRIRVKLINSSKLEDIVLPGNDCNTDHYGVVPCCLSIHLLAAAYSFATENENTGRHARALVTFSIQYINRVITLDDILTTMRNVSEIKDTRPSGRMLVNILVLLLSNSSFRGTSNPFIREMLSYKNWIPREQPSLNPIQQAIKSRNHDIVPTLVDYCIENAKRHHPAYLTPAIQSLNGLNEHYRELTTRMFSEASYIKVRNKPYVAANATIVNPHYKFWKPRSKSLEDYINPVLYLRSQLPFWSNTQSAFTKVLLGRPSTQSDRVTYFTDKHLEENGEFIPDIYVTPFPGLSTYSNKGRKASSRFVSIAGTKLLDNPAMIATLRFKWYKYAKARWAIRFSLVLIYSLLFLTITAVQISADSKSSTSVASGLNDIIESKYLKNWAPALYIVITLGCTCIMFEIWQFILDPKDYFRSPYNYLDLISFILPIVGCGQVLNASRETLQPEGPEQIWWISFALLAVYLNLMFELKVFRPLGTVVHIILNITGRILWFLAILAIALVAFTHAFMHITHTKQDPCISMTGDDLTACEAAKSEYPGNPFNALFSTFFFIAGIYDPLGNDLDPSSTSGISFKILLAFFILFIVVLLMNVLIAIMNDGYSESRDEGQLAWLKQWSLVIVETELSMMGNTTRGSRDLFPDYIYYGANQQDVEEHAKKTSETRSLEVSKIQGPQPYVVTQKNFKSEIGTLKSSQDRIQNEVTQMSELVRSLIGRLDQHVPASQYDQEFSLMESNFYSPSPTMSSLTAASVISSSIESRHMMRDRSYSELVTNTSSRPRMPMAEPQKRHLGSQHRRRTSGSTHGAVVNPGSSLPTSAQKTQPPPTPASPESTDTSVTTTLTYEADVEVKETSKITGPAASNGSPWSHGVISEAEAVACDTNGVVSDDTGAVCENAAIAKSPVSGAAGAAVHGSESAAHGVGHVAEAVAIGTGAVVVGDEVCPIAKTSYVYYDDDVYDAVLVEKNTEVTYVTQIIYDTETKAGAGAGAVGDASSAVAHGASEADDVAGSAAKSAAHSVGSAASGAAGAVVHGAESAAIGTGAVVIEGDLLATGALHKVDGVWKRTLQVLTTRRAHVDEVCPIAKTSYVYYDDDVYDAVLTENGTGVRYVTQLIYDTETKVYYVYYRYGETDYKLDGPHKTIEAAKEAFQLTYKDKFDVEWTEREAAVSDKWTYETKTYETFQEVEEVEEVVDETKAQEIISQQECEVEEEPTTVTETSTTEEVVITEGGEVTKPTESKGSFFGRIVSSTKAGAGAIGDVVGDASSAVAHGATGAVGAVGAAASGTADAVVHGATEAVDAAGSATKPPVHSVRSAASGAAGAVVHGAESAAHGVGHVAEAVAIGTGAVVIGGGLLATGALHKVDGVWKRTVQVLTTRKAHVDEVCPIAKTSYVYYDDDVYDAVLTEKGTGVGYVTQLIYDTETKVYYVYYRYGETDYKLDGPHKTIEAAKEAFQLTYKDKFNVEWTERENAVSDKWTYETKTYETFEEVEEVEEVVPEGKAQDIISQQEREVEEKPAIVTETATTTTTPEEVIVVEEGEFCKPTESKGSLFGRLVSSTKAAAGAVGDDASSAAVRGATGAVGAIGAAASGTAGAVVHGTTEAVDAAGSATKSPIHSVGSAASGAAEAVVHGAESAAHGVGHVAEAVAIGTGAVVIGGGLLATGALHKVDGVWKRTVQVLTTRKAHVDEVCPIAETSYVYYDDDVYDAVLTENGTGVRYVTQLIYDTETKVYYVYYRYGETDYKLDGPHKTIEAAKEAFQLTYKDKFDVEWTEREAAVSDKWTYETKTYETFQEVEEVEEVVDETKAQEIISQQECEVEEEPTTVTETSTTEEVVITEGGEVTKPTESKGSFFGRIVSSTKAGAGAVGDVVGDASSTVAHGASEAVDAAGSAAKSPAYSVGSVTAGATGIVIHGTESDASGVGHVTEAVAIGAGPVVVGGGLAAGALRKVGGVWKRTRKALTTRKAHGVEIRPIDSSYICCDSIGDVSYAKGIAEEEQYTCETKTYETFEEEEEEVEEFTNGIEASKITPHQGHVVKNGVTAIETTTATTAIKPAHKKVDEQEEEEVIMDAVVEKVVNDAAVTAGVKTGDVIVENPVDEGEPVQVITAATTGAGAAPGNSSKDSLDRPQYRGRPQKSNIFTYNIKRQNTDEVDYVSGSGHQQHRDDYESDDEDGYKQSKTRRRLAAKARAKYLDDD